MRNLSPIIISPKALKAFYAFCIFREACRICVRLPSSTLNGIASRECQMESRRENVKWNRVARMSNGIASRECQMESRRENVKWNRVARMSNGIASRECQMESRRENVDPRFVPYSELFEINKEKFQCLNESSST